MDEKILPHGNGDAELLAALNRIADSIDSLCRVGINISCVLQDNSLAHEGSLSEIAEAIRKRRGN